MSVVEPFTPEGINPNSSYLATCINRVNTNYKTTKQDNLTPSTILYGIGSNITALDYNKITLNKPSVFPPDLTPSTILYGNGSNITNLTYGNITGVPAFLLKTGDNMTGTLNVITSAPNSLQVRNTTLNSNANMLFINNFSITASVGIGGASNYNNNLYLESPNSLILNTGGNSSTSVPRMIINSTGNIGVGVLSALQKMHIQGSSPSMIRIETDVNTIGQVSGLEFGNPTFSSANSVKILSTTTAANKADLQFYTTNGGATISRLIIKDDGKIGVGVSPTGVYNFEVLTTSNGEGIKVENGSLNGWSALNAGVSAKPGFVAFHRADDTRIGYIGWTTTTNYFDMIAENGYLGYINNGNFISNRLTIGSSTVNNTYGIQIADNANYTTQLRCDGGSSKIPLSIGIGEVQVDSASFAGGRLTIKENGLVGIGTTNPLQRLHIQSASPAMIRVETAVNAPAQVAGIEFGIRDFVSANSAKILSTSIAGSLNDLQFYTSNGAASISRLNIGGNGKIGMGTPPSATYTLDVQTGTNGEGIRVQNGSSNGWISIFAGSSANPGYISFFNNTNTRVAYIGWQNLAGYLDMVAENGYTGYRVTGNFIVTGNCGIGDVPHSTSTKLTVKSGSSLQPLVRLEQTTGWDSSNFVLQTIGYSSIGGLRVNGADGINTLYSATNDITLSVVNPRLIKFSGNSGGAMVMTIGESAVNINQTLTVNANTYLYAGLTSNSFILTSAYVQADGVATKSYFSIPYDVNGIWTMTVGTSNTGKTNSFILNHVRNTGINSKWWFDGTQTSTNVDISDHRSKRDIQEIDEALVIIDQLEPKSFNVLLDKDIVKQYGFLAHDIEQIPALSKLVYTSTDYIGNINAEVDTIEKLDNGNMILTSKTDLNVNVGDELKLAADNTNDKTKEIIIDSTPYMNRYKRRYGKVINVLANNKIEIDLDVDNMDLSDNYLIYGKKVEDAKSLDYTSFTALNTKAIQELYKIIKEQQQQIAFLMSKF